MSDESTSELRKRRLDGNLYKRPPEIEAQLGNIKQLAREEVARRCSIEDEKANDYLASECVLHLVRELRSSPMDDHLELMFNTLMARVRKGLPVAELGAKGGDDLKDGNVRDEGFYRFLEMLMQDRQEYLEKLDFFEVRFASAIKALRQTVERDLRRKEGLKQEIEDKETGEVSEEVERAAGRFDRAIGEEFETGDDLLCMNRAIDSLPPLEKAIIELERKGMLDQSEDPNAVTISKVLRKDPKTIRAYRKKAYAALEVVLRKGEK